MKKLSILFLLVSLLFGGMSVEAKTTKKSKARTSQSAKKQDDETFTKKYKGKIGPYEVIVTLTFYDYDYDSFVSSNNWKVKGSYVYTEAGNKLNLKGDFASLGPGMTLEEFTPKGKKSAKWYLSSVETNDDPWFDAFEGEFENLSNGKKFKVYLRAID